MSKESLWKSPWFKYLLGGFILGIIVIVGINWGMKVTDSRPFCASCHIMEQAAVTNKLSIHANLSCNDCHAPHELWRKIPFKAKEGIRDFYMNTIGNAQLPIIPGTETKEVVNENCKACHAISNMTVSSTEAKPYCVDCHRDMKHMHMQPISKRIVADD
ncbi:NapC/NirT family cytochrome c [Lawsonia intracellularis]|uniref:Cytochrome c nitrite reductase small subunit n=1 Tax=Lawsonia intracellularis (strain PHE/MN1-00) TaxID=363253 RepID=Q1MPM2_LAWIP|nr:NapC/NirT family cytochrome c [Lawsonia intracellularis]AGC50432.1 NapC/NirT cytochrome c family protein [Lawsonia intracellularis N343]KAA0204455.1 7-cyano-7-deazaguanine reductase [Lawsonia intracellularis]MBZ3892880.1 NapC/NirT family cytochrome c [Lawsonia intracellularis]OMQ02902.1 7-cyano-7-deazaguanine reductase [Lawsonia intracellularis]RBN32960.1 7-cyano-7-deazaguanine reductase [Lawsonia intracellularis]